LQFEVSQPILVTAAAKRQPQKKCSLNYKQATKGRKRQRKGTHNLTLALTLTLGADTMTQSAQLSTWYTITHGETLTAACCCRC